MPGKSFPSKYSKNAPPAVDKCEKESLLLLFFIAAKVSPPPKTEFKDLSMVFIVGFYFLNILDANIDAHLLDFNVDEDLSFQPYFENDELFNPNIGLKIKISL